MGDLSLKSLRTEGGGQVSGAGGEAVRKILHEYGMIRKLSSEGGRTSRGSIAYAEAYTTVLEKLKKSGELGASNKEIRESLKQIEGYWVKVIQRFFDSQRLKISIDPNLAMGEAISEILTQAKERQRRLQGVQVEGAVLQHLVGAKLALALGDETVAHHTCSTADLPSGRGGDFCIAEVVIHVTTAPTEALMRKCRDNSYKGLRPIVVCPRDTVQAALQLAANIGIREKLDIYDAQSFISMNLNEISRFNIVKLKQTTLEFMEKYNEIISKHENDQSLQLEEK